MAKYHVNDSGEPGLCKASKGNCPFGGEANHYSSKENARAAYELSMASTHKVLKAKKKSSIEAIVEAQNRRKLKDFSTIFVSLNYGDDVEVNMDDFRETHEKLNELASTKATVGNMFERAKRLRAAYREHVLSSDSNDLLSDEELDDDLYLHTVAPATASSSLALEKELWKHDWATRGDGDELEDTVRNFSELLKRNMSVPGAGKDALGYLRSKGWNLDEDEAQAEILKDAILAGQREALTHGAAFEFEQKRLL